MTLIATLLISLLFAGVVIGVVWFVRSRLVRRAHSLGYDRIGTYLRAAPNSDAEKLDAIDLALKGLVVTFLGVLFAPLIIVGLIPLYYGLRKISLTLMGMGLTDSASD